MLSGAFRMLPALGFLLLAPLAFPQQSQVAAAQQHLLSLKAKEMDTSISPAIQSAIVELKSALAAQIDAVMQQLPPQATAVTAQKTVAAVMPSPTIGKWTDAEEKAQASGPAFQTRAGFYGGELQVSVTQPEPSLLIVQESFAIMCGGDNILLVYRSKGGHWQRIATWQSNPYDQISGAFGDAYEVRLLHPKLNGNPLLLVVHGTPWCSSVMSVLHMDVLELGSSPTETATWHADHDYRIDDDSPRAAKLTPDGFEIRASVSSLNHEGQVSRKGVMRYALIDGAIHRVEPIAMNAQDSVEEWLNMPRSEAKDFADDTPASLTSKMFQEFTWEGRPNDASALIPSVGAVRACRNAKDHYQAEVTSESFDPSGEAKQHPGPAYFVQMKEVPNGYRIHTVTAKADASCNGPDLTGNF